MKFLLIFLSLITFNIYSQETFKTEVKYNIKLRKLPDTFSKTLNVILEKGQIVEILDYKDDYWLVKNNMNTGWLPTESIYRISRMNDDLNDYRKKRLISNYGDIDGNKILNGETWIGMTVDMLIEVKGTYQSANTITTRPDIRQLIYNNQYFYSKDGIIIEIQKF